MHFSSSFVRQISFLSKKNKICLLLRARGVEDETKNPKIKKKYLTKALSQEKTIYPDQCSGQGACVTGESIGCTIVKIVANTTTVIQVEAQKQSNKHTQEQFVSTRLALL